MPYRPEPTRRDLRDRTPLFTFGPPPRPPRVSPWPLLWRAAVIVGGLVLLARELHRYGYL